MGLLMEEQDGARGRGQSNHHHYCSDNPIPVRRVPILRLDSASLFFFFEHSIS